MDPRDKRKRLSLKGKEAGLVGQPGLTCADENRGDQPSARELKAWATAGEPNLSIDCFIVSAMQA